MDFRLQRRTSRIVTESQMCTDLLETIPLEFASWTNGVVLLMGIVTNITYITPSVHRFENNNQRQQQGWETFSIGAHMVGMNAFSK